MRAGLADMATRILGANSIIQGALPRILRDTPQDWFDENMAFIEVTNKLKITHVYLSIFCSTLVLSGECKNFVCLIRKISFLSNSDSHHHFSSTRILPTWLVILCRKFLV